MEKQNREELRVRGVLCYSNAYENRWNDDTEVEGYFRRLCGLDDDCVDCVIMPKDDMEKHVKVVFNPDLYKSDKDYFKKGSFNQCICIFWGSRDFDYYDPVLGCQIHEIDSSHINSSFDRLGINCAVADFFKNGEFINLFVSPFIDKDYRKHPRLYDIISEREKETYRMNCAHCYSSAYLNRFNALNIDNIDKYFEELLNIAGGVQGVIMEDILKKGEESLVCILYGDVKMVEEIKKYELSGKFDRHVLFSLGEYDADYYDPVTETEIYVINKNRLSTTDCIDIALALYKFFKNGKFINPFSKDELDEANFIIS